MATKKTKLELAKAIASKVKKPKRSSVARYTAQGQGHPQYPNAWTEPADENVSAKPVGWRWTNAGATKLNKGLQSKPSRADIEQYKGKTFRYKGETVRYLYQEKRVDKSDLKKSAKFKNGGSTFSGREYDPYNEQMDGDKRAKHVGWRWTDDGAKILKKDVNKRPSEADIEMYRDDTFRGKLKGKSGSVNRHFLYNESRQDKADASPSKKYQSLKSGGSIFSGREYDPYNEQMDGDKRAKHVGWRWTDDGAKILKKDVNKRPSEADIEMYRDDTFRGKLKGKSGSVNRHFLYNESRQDKADASPSKKFLSLEDGGTLGAGSFKRGGYTPQYVRNEDIESITLTSGKVIKNNSIYDGAYVSKSLKLARGGRTTYRPQYVPNGDIESITLTSGKVIKNDSIYDGAYVSKSLKLASGGEANGEWVSAYGRGGVERVANSQARDYSENLIPFKGANLEGKVLDNGDYAVLSYGHYPLWWFCKGEGKWYGNSTKYSVSTSKQMTQSRPTYDATMLSKNDLTDMMMKHHAKFEDGGVLDSILGDTNAPSQNIGGTTFSTTDLTSHLDLNNPNF
jgi:hypothetical protein